MDGSQPEATGHSWDHKGSLEKIPTISKRLNKSVHYFYKEK